MSRDKFRPNEPEEVVNQPVVHEEPKVAAPTSATAEVVQCVKLNVRGRPNPKADVIDVITAGTRVVVNLTFKNDKYYEILASSGKKGYAMKTYLSFIEG